MVNIFLQSPDSSSLGDERDPLIPYHNKARKVQFSSQVEEIPLEEVKSMTLC